jgi:hypothetical protein
MPILTDEQKEQLKMARRASMRIEETWSLYTMFLSQDKRPLEALERAQEAVAVWVEWMDNNEVDPPEIEHPDVMDQMTTAMQKMAETFKSAGVPTIPFFLPQTPVDAEFIEEAPSATASTESQSPAERSNPKKDQGIEEGSRGSDSRSLQGNER